MLGSHKAEKLHAGKLESLKLELFIFFQFLAHNFKAFELISLPASKPVAAL
jgi:hypothetical protein